MAWNPDDWLNIPDELKAIPHWMVCKGMDDKRPLTLGGYYGDLRNPEHWTTFSEAYMTALEHGWCIGFCLSDGDPFTIIDMDNKSNDEVSLDIINEAYRQLDTYIERSISGQGLHAVLYGDIGLGRRRTPIELYSRERFMIMTGDVVKPARISSAYQEWLNQTAEWCGIASEYQEVLIDWDSPVTSEELAYDDWLAQNFDNFGNRREIEYWFYAQDFLDPTNNQHSECDAALMQLFYTFNAGRPQRDLATVRMFMRSARARYLGRKTNPRQYVERTFSFVKSKIDTNELQISGLQGLVNNVGSNLMNGHARQNGHIEQRAEIGGQWKPPTIQQNPFVFFSASELKTRPDVPWAVHNLLPVGGLAAIYGESGAGKSFIALDMIGAIARGVNWFRRKVMQLPVCCLALEGSGGLKKRVIAWERAHGIDFPEEVKFYDGAFSLRADGGGFGRPGNVATLHQFCAALNAGDKFGGVVFVDTLNQASEGADENSSRDMNQLIQGMKLIQQLTGSLVVAVHHATKNRENQSMRGHGSFKAACDAVIEVYEEFDDKGKRTGNRGWLAEKVKDAESGERGAFQLKKEFGTNSTAIREMWEPVVVHDEETGDDHFEERPVEVTKAAKPARGENAPFDGARSERQWSGGKRQQEVLSVIRKFLDGKKAEYEQVKNAVLDALLPSGASGTAKRDLLRVVERLVNRGTLHLRKEANSELVWL